MNVNRTEGCLWHCRLPDQEKRQSTEATRFIQLMTKMAEKPHGSTEKPTLKQLKQRYRLIGSSVPGLICEIEMREDKTFLKVLVPQRNLCCQLKHFSARLHAGMLAAGHNVVLEVVHDTDLF